MNARLYDTIACTVKEAGLTVNELVVAGVVMVTVTPLLMKLTCPSGPAVIIEKEVVGCSEGGLLMPVN